MKALQTGNPIVENLEKKIKEYKKRAESITKSLQEIENERTRIINSIEEASYNGLDKYTASRLEDKLNRPYALILYKL